MVEAELLNFCCSRMDETFVGSIGVLLREAWMNARFSCTHHTCVNQRGGLHIFLSRPWHFENHNFETRDPRVWVFLKNCWWIYKRILPPKKNGKVKTPVWWSSCNICMISTGVICISNTRLCHLQWQWKVMKGFPLISHHLGWKSVSSWNPSVLILQSSQVLGSNNLFFPLEVHPKFRMFHLKISLWKRIFFWKPWFSEFMWTFGDVVHNCWGRTIFVYNLQSYLKIIAQLHNSSTQRLPYIFKEKYSVKKWSPFQPKLSSYPNTA